MIENDSLQSASVEYSCRLCEGKLQRAFSLPVLQKYTVDYLKCIDCDSLQTEPPYWTHEAYTNNLSILDTGAAQRNLSNLAAVYAVARTLRRKAILDFGGGDGLLCRLLRDYKLNCFVNDKFASATYARAYTVPNFSQPEILLAFEVLEHFEDPRRELKILFESNPPIVLASTAMFSGQGPDWWYLAPETGQHVFFYSEKALRFIANSFDYGLLICSGHILFLRAGTVSASARRIISFLLTRHMLRVVSSIMRLLPTTGVANDFDSLRSQVK